MSCLTQALLPKSVAESCDYHTLYNPDNHGGFEMGTWTFGTYLQVFDRAIIKSGLSPIVYPKRGDQIRVGASVEEMLKNQKGGYWLGRVFAPAECTAIARGLKKMRIGKINGHSCYHYLYDNDKSHPFSFGGYVKWQKRLIQLFEKGDIIWYSM